MIKTWVFDLDNTLYDYDSCNQGAERVLFQELNHRWGLDECACKRLLRDAKSDVKQRLGTVASSHNRLLYMQNICERLGVKSSQFALGLYDVYWESFLTQVRVFPQMKTLLDALKNNNKTTVLLTDLTAQIQFRKLRSMQLEDSFDYVITSEEVGIEKPNEEMFRRVIEKTGCKKEEIIMIGDDRVKDVEGAEKYGFRALLFRNDESFYDEVQLWM